MHWGTDLVWECQSGVLIRLQELNEPTHEEQHSRAAGAETEECTKYFLLFFKST